MWKKKILAKSSQALSAFAARKALTSNSSKAPTSQNGETHVEDDPKKSKPGSPGLPQSDITAGNGILKLVIVGTESAINQPSMDLDGSTQESSYASSDPHEPFFSKILTSRQV